MIIWRWSTDPRPVSGDECAAERARGSGRRIDSFSLLLRG
jgi:hypothetical protein